MKQKKLKTFGLLSLGLVTTSLVVTLLVGNGIKPTHVNAGEHSQDCNWNHYLAKDPTEYVPGNKEYWVCCVDHKHVFTAPTADQGTINEGDKSLTEEQLNELAADDDRYVAPTKVEVIKTLINNLESLDKSSLSLWNGGQILEIRNEYDALASSAKGLVTNLSTLEEYETAYASVGTAYSNSWKSGDVEATYVTSFKSSNAIDETYGFYTEFSEVSVSSGWPSFSSTSEGTISGTAKIAIYVPSATSINVYSKGWALLAQSVALTQGWNDIELTNIPENNLVSTISFAFVSFKSELASGIRLTPIYSLNYTTVAKTVIAKIEALKSLDKSALTLWNGGQILEARKAYNALPSYTQEYVTNLSTLEEYETAYAEVGTAYNTEWKTGYLETTFVASFTSSNGIDSSYGFYTEFNNLSHTGSWPSFSPVSDGAISGKAKLAIYNPTEGSVQVQVFAAKDWTAKLITNIGAGWNEITVDGLSDDFAVNQLTVAITGFNANLTSGLRITPVYSAK